MKPVLQKVVDNVSGDCFAACLASVLELPEVPNLHSTGTRHMWDRYNEWLKPYNLQVVFCAFGHIPAPQGYLILSVKSAMFQGAAHSVVAYNDQDSGILSIVWNPNPKDPRGCDIPALDWLGYHILALRNPAGFINLRVVGTEGF